MSSDKYWINVCHVDDLQPDSGVCALIGGQQVALFYDPREPTVYAIGNYDPFGQVNVLSRGLMGDIKGVPMVSSPLYKQHFNLLTGQCLDDETISVKAYQARINNDRVEIRL